MAKSATDVMLEQNELRIWSQATSTKTVAGHAQSHLALTQVLATKQFNHRPISKNDISVPYHAQVLSLAEGAAHPLSLTVQPRSKVKIKLFPRTLMRGMTGYIALPKP